MNKIPYSFDPSHNLSLGWNMNGISFVAHAAGNRFAWVWWLDETPVPHTKYECTSCDDRWFSFRVDAPTADICPKCNGLGMEVTDES